MKLRMPFLALTLALSAPVVAASFSTGETRVGDEPPKVEEARPLEVGSVVPETIELKDFEGKATSFKQLRDKVVILHFWSDRCPAEIHADPIFKQMEKRYAGSKDVVLLGIASNQNELGAKPEADADFSKYYTALRTKRDKVGYEHTILADHGNVVSDLFQARSTPHCYVIDKKGVIQYAGALDNDPRGDKGEEAVNYLNDAAAAILKGEKPAVTETKPYG